MEAVTSVADARAGLSMTLKRFRSSPDAPPVVLGSHRKPEAVLLPYSSYTALLHRPSAGGATTAWGDLVARRDLILRLAALNRIRSVSVFGSVAREEETTGSDVDLIVDPSPDATLFDLAQFATDVETITGRSVDVVSSKALDSERDREILEQSRPL